MEKAVQQFGAQAPLSVQYVTFELRMSLSNVNRLVPETE